MDIVLLIGKILFGGYFIYSGVAHFTKLDAMTGYASSKGVPMAKAGVILSGIMMVLGGASVIANFHAKIGLILIGVFLVVVTVMIHQFWKQTDPMMRMGDAVNFNKNVGLLGATLILLAMQ